MTEDRIKALMKGLPVGGTWNKEKKKTETKIFAEFNDIFLLERNKLTHANEVMHNIRFSRKAKRDQKDAGN